MDIKLKNRSIAIIWVLFFTYGLCSIVSFLSHSDQFMVSYYHTKPFEDKLNQFVSYLSMYELDPMTKAEAKSQLSVSDHEIKEYMASNAQPASSQSIDRVRKIILKDKQDTIDSYFKKKEQLRSQFTDVLSSFHYYLKNTKTGKIYTDLNAKDTQSLDQYLKKMAFIQRYHSPAYGYLSTMGENSYLGDVPFVQPTSDTYSGFIAVPASLPNNSTVKTDRQHFHRQQVTFFSYTICGFLALILSLLILKKVPVFAFVENEGWQSLYRRIPADLCLAAAFITFLFTYVNLTDTGYSFIYGSIYHTIKQIFITAFTVALTLIQGVWLYHRLKTPERTVSEWNRSFIRKGKEGIADIFLNIGTGIQMLLLLGIVFATGFGFMVVLMSPGAIVIYIPLFLLVTLPTLIITSVRIGAFNRILHHTSSLARGNEEPDLKVAGKSDLATLAGNINVLKHGVETSQAEQAKSERFKTELITNVSHDLRTPLTSIITYTELLKTPELQEDERDTYVEIIDRKSKRLKVLIEDLFEASKMASGSIDLMKEKVDMTQLLEQALAENDERIEQSALQFRVTKPEHPIYCVVDGQKIWRVFDNLIGNILKYAMEMTRVYITMQATKHQVQITFKNISQYELNESAEELFERFKRGDTSRHTDGSGLGLAIAKSIIDLHGGSLDIEVDGDLFKVTVILQAAL